MMGKRITLGRHHGVPVVVEFPCSDICPQYTTQIIHYDIAPGAACEAAGGVTLDAARAVQHRHGQTRFLHSKAAAAAPLSASSIAGARPKRPWTRGSPDV